MLDALDYSNILSVPVVVPNAQLVPPMKQGMKRGVNFEVEHFPFIGFRVSYDFNGFQNFIKSFKTIHTLPFSISQRCSAPSLWPLTHRITQEANESIAAINQNEALVGFCIVRQ